MFRRREGDSSGALRAVEEEEKEVRFASESRDGGGISPL